MSAPDSLQLDEHLARLLAAYDQGLGDGDGTARTIDVPLGPDGKPVMPERPAAAPPDAAGTDLPADPDRTQGYAEPHAPPSTPAPPGPPHRVGRFELRRQL